MFASDSARNGSSKKPAMSLFRAVLLGATLGLPAVSPSVTKAAGFEPCNFNTLEDCLAGATTILNQDKASCQDALTQCFIDCSGRSGFARLCCEGKCSLDYASCILGATTLQIARVTQCGLKFAGRAFVPDRLSPPVSLVQLQGPGGQGSVQRGLGVDGVLGESPVDSVWLSEGTDLVVEYGWAPGFSELIVEFYSDALAEGKPDLVLTDPGTPEGFFVSIPHSVLSARDPSGSAPGASDARRAFRPVGC